MFKIMNYKYFWLFLKIIVSASVLTYLLVTVSFTEILNALKSANILFVIIALLLAAPINYLSAFQTHYLTKIQGMKLTVLTILKINLVTTYYSLFLPGMLSGGAVKWYKFSKYGARSSAAAVVVLNRFIETFVTLLIGIVFLIPELYISGSLELLNFLTTLCMLLIIVYMFLFNERINRFLITLVYKLPSPKIIRSKIHNFFIAMNQFRVLTVKDHFEVVGIVIFYNLIGVLSFFFFAKALNIELSLFTIGWIRSALSIVTLLPFSFAGFGIREGSLIVLLNQYGVATYISIAFSFLLFSRNLITAGIGGVLDLLPPIEHIDKKLAVESADDH